MAVVSAVLITGCATEQPEPTEPSPEPRVEAKPERPPFDEARMAAADEAIEQAIEEGDLPGAVLAVGLGGEIVYHKAYGHRAVEPDPEPMTRDTIFDLASLTKPVATATAVMILIDRGAVDPAEPVATYLPAFASGGKDNITVEQLLLHQGGLAPANAMSDYADGPEKAIERILTAGPRWEPGSRFAYTDLGFIVLGKLVEAVDGRPLERFTREEIYQPLGMSETTYLPPADWRNRIAPTERRDGAWMRGDVHDPRAYALGGVAGHAGVFGTATDLGRFCEMFIRGGELDGRRILSEQAVENMTRVRYLEDEKDGRGYGLDIDTAYSSPRGERFAVGTTFGHSGFTGTSFWVDPENEAWIVLLSNRVHPDGDGRVVPLRRKVATIAAEAILDADGRE